MKKLAKGIVMIFSITVMLGVIGCMGNFNRKSVKEQMLEHMKNKYEEEFEAVSVDAEVWSASYNEMIVHSEKFPNGRIVVRKSGDVYSDNYVDFLMKNKIEQEMTSIVSQVYAEAKVIYIPGGPALPDRVNKDMSVEEYTKSKLVPLSLIICISDPNYETTRDQKIEQLRDMLEKKDYQSELNVFYLYSGKLGLINDSNFNELLNKVSVKNWAVIEGYFLMDDSYKFHSGEWEEIK